MSWRDQQVAVMMDKLSGAADVATAAAGMLAAFGLERVYTDTGELLQALQQIGKELLTAQSGMASLVALFNRIFFATAAEIDPEAASIVLRETAEAFIKEQNSARETLSRKATALLPIEVSLLTNSSSSSVFQTILHANQLGRRPRIFCPESRPFYEGRDQAVRLARNGINVVLIMDNAIYSNLREIELVLIGADSLTEEGVVSKIGTAGITVCAQSVGIPCYVLADTFKIWPSALGEQPIHERPPRDVWPEAPDNLGQELKIQNRVYDTAPWDAIAGIITEHGLLTASEVHAQCRSRPIHRLLQTIISEVRSTL